MSGNRTQKTKRKAPAKTAQKKRRKKTVKKHWLKSTIKYLLIIGLIALLALIAFSVYLNAKVVSAFEGKRFALPARVYARPLELYSGAKISPTVLLQELRRLRYKRVPSVSSPGEYTKEGSTLYIYLRAFDFWDERQPAMRIRVQLGNDALRSVVEAQNELDVLARLDPLVIGGIFPNGGEDRELVRIDDVPRDLVNALIAIEDKRFFEHHGVDPKAVLRAVSTLLFSERAHGGSTITQQLVKNFYLTHERTIQRKFTEMIMALLLEYHYNKAEILETYINEVFLGQDGDRAVHGFALASQFYFAKNLDQLQLEEAALLVGMLKGPNYYNPRRNPQRATQRRNLVLQEMQQQSLITQDKLDILKAKPLGLSEKPRVGQSLYPAFLQLVVRQLQQNYREEDLRSEGLRVFTSLDPFVQKVAEDTLQQRLNKLETRYGLKKDILQAAMVITDTNNGELTALVGGRDPHYKGFNRALDASRQIGSLIKPAIYLTALEQGYHLTTPLDDSPFVWREAGIEDWQPHNYDGEFHGEVPLWQALAKSYNVSAARLGTELGVQKVMETVRRLGVEKTLPTFASGLLGTVELSPFEVAQMYASLAAGGFKTPFRAIREVTTKEGQPLNRYPVSTAPVASAGANYLTVSAMQQVVKRGTAKGLQHYLDENLDIAGKTGTTDALRDSWFAGFSGDRLAVTWVGNDDNQSIGLTGASGALVIWGEVMQKLNLSGLALTKPEGIEMLPIDTETGFISENCQSTFSLPHMLETLPKEKLTCLNPRDGKMKRWFKRIFGQ